jgi:membrane protein YdbS with pleckstrin-like domain
MPCLRAFRQGPPRKTPSDYLVRVSFRRRLNQGEEVVLETHPHWWYLTGTVFAVVAVIAGAAAGAIEHAPSWAGWLSLAALALSLGWLLVRYGKWRTTRLIVTNRRLIERRGFFGRRGREIPLMALSDVSYHQTLFERLIGAGTVVLESAGRDSRETFPDLPHPGHIHDEIYNQIDAARRSYYGGAQAPSIPEQIDQLDQLRQRGVISDAEFEQKKSQLLNRL